MGRGKQSTALVSQIAPSKEKRFQMQGQKMLMQRIGVLKPVRQKSMSFGREPGITKVGRRNPRAPEGKGIWAFPYPCLDTYFTVAQFEMATPKWLRQLHEKAREDNEAWDEYETAYKAWRKTPEARKQLQIREFWVSGSVYTHLGASGDSEWQLVPVTQLAEMMKKQYAQDAAHVKRWESPHMKAKGEAYDHRRFSHRGPWPTSTDHLELFLGKDAKIH